MSVAAIKEEIKNLEAPQLDEVAALILVLQLRRAKDPERKKSGIGTHRR